MSLKEDSSAGASRELRASLFRITYCSAAASDSAIISATVVSVTCKIDLVDSYIPMQTLYKLEIVFVTLSTLKILLSAESLT